jgi:microcystin-dependent protein
MVYETDTFSTRLWTGTAWVGTPPSGTLQPFAGATSPDGWLLCFGQAIARTGVYADLFAALGITHGVGNGSTTFNLPDLRGRVPAGKDNMGGTSASRLITNVTGGTLGAAGGSESHTLTTDQMPSHAHAEDGAHNNTVTTAYASGSNNFLQTGSVTRNTGSTGGGGAHNNTQPTIILNYIIKV